jgi:hypothetical protein
VLFGAIDQGRLKNRYIISHPHRRVATIEHGMPVRRTENIPMMFSPAMIGKLPAIVGPAAVGMQPNDIVSIQKTKRKNETAQNVSWQNRKLLRILL